MNDFLKGAGIAILGLALFSGFAAERARFAAKRDLERAIPDSHFQVSVKPKGIFGMVLGKADSATVRGTGFTIQTLPFVVEPRGGLLGRLGSLKLDLQDITLRDLPVKTLNVTIPRVDIDAVRVLFNGHFTIRGAESGEGVAVITAAGLRDFIARKRPEFRDMTVSLAAGEALVTGRASLFLSPTPMTANVKIGVADGRYLNAMEARVKLGNQEVPALLTQRLLQAINPIIDVERDLGLADWLYVTSAEIGDGILTVRARVTVPRKSRPPMEKP